MQNPKAILFNYTPSLWPKAFVLLFATSYLALVFISPLPFFYQSLSTLLALLLAYLSLKTLSQDLPIKVCISPVQSHVVFAKQNLPQNAELTAYSHVTQQYLILRLYLLQEKRHITLFLHARKIGEDNYRALCRHLLHHFKIRRD